MRITQGHVRAIADAIQDMTGKQLGRVNFGLDYSGKGTRVIRMDRQDGWYGRNSLRRAAAFYLGLYERLGAAGDGALPDKIAEAACIVWRAGLTDGPDFIKGVTEAANHLEKIARWS